MSFRPTGSPRSGRLRETFGVLPRDRARPLDVEIGEGADVLLARRNRGGAQIDKSLRREVARLDAACEVERGEQAVGTREHGGFPVGPAA